MLGDPSSVLPKHELNAYDRAIGAETSELLGGISGEIFIGVTTGGASTASRLGRTVAIVDTLSNAYQVGSGIQDIRQNGLTLQNSLQVAGSALGVAGNVSGAVRSLDDVAEAAVVTRVADDAPSANFAKPTTVDEVYNPSNGQLRVLQEQCFAAGTPVATEDGLRPIETLAAGERVWSFDLHEQKWRLCVVRETFAVEHDGDLYEVSVAGDAITSSYHHPYWVIEGEQLADRPTPEHVQAALDEGGTSPGRWVDAGDLQLGDLLLLRDGRQESVTEISIRHGEETLYNFAVDDLHNYAVGNFAVLVHNNCYEELVEQAKLKYPKKALRSDELHHIDPKYLTGHSGGPKVELPAAYHQEVTNAFRREQPYRTGPVSAERLQGIKDRVYGEWPLPPGTEF